jgi:hypothetical protein
MTAKARDVFISYSREDKLTADAICATLESAAIRCWIAPRDLQPGRSFAGEITRAIQASKIMVLVFSAHSNQSEQVLLPPASGIWPPFLFGSWCGPVVHSGNVIAGAGGACISSTITPAASSSS